MGAGASAQKLEKARVCDQEADELFGKLDTGSGKTGFGRGDNSLSALEIFDFIESHHVDWNPVQIKEAIELFDVNKDGGICRDEFKKALKIMQDKQGPPPKRGMKRSFTFKDARVKNASTNADSQVDAAVDARAKERAERTKKLEEARAELERKRAERLANAALDNP